MKLDKYFTSLQKAGGSKEDLIKAGWLESSPSEVDYNLEHYTIPVDLIRDAAEDEVSVILYPGCFAPIHKGHITAMNLAKKTIETMTGETVVAGYYTPDHDAYIMRKTSNDERFIAENRIHTIYEKTSHESWTAVNSWVALEAPGDLNFTIYYDHLLTYLKHWVPQKTIKLYLVFGGDNYLFANAFTEHGHAVCIPRKGIDVDMTQITPGAAKRVIWGTEYSTSHSSTKERMKLKTANIEEVNPSSYIIRNDLKLSLPGNNKLSNEEILLKVKAILAASVPEGLKLQISSIDIEEQLTCKIATDHHISMDCFWEAPQMLQITRLFSSSDSQLYPICYTNRPGSLPILAQLNNIPKQSYTLVDDDIATGKTMSFAKNLLYIHGIETNRTESLIDEIQNDLYDVVDLRDFILGSLHGGLTVVTPNGQITRTPYMHPYVNLVTRAKLEPSKIREASYNLWLLNQELYAGTNITVGDIKELQDFTLFRYHEKMTLEELSEIHAKQLKK